MNRRKRGFSLLALSLIFLCTTSAQTIFPARAMMDAERANSRTVKISLSGSAGCSYVLQGSDSFADWQSIRTNASDSGTFSLDLPAPAERMFYRAVTLCSTISPNSEWLFNCVDLGGWNGSAALFRAQNCEIAAGDLTHTIVQNEFLCTDRSFTDFTLRLNFKLLGVGNGFINSGIQFRSKRIPNSTEVAGYQADMGEGYWGSLYDEARRGVILAAANQTTVKSFLRPNDWNSYTVVAQGRRIRLFLNDHLTADYTETDTTIPLSGIIGLQLHQGGPTQVSFKDIQLIR
jgi:hypothetical protein